LAVFNLLPESGLSFISPAAYTVGTFPALYAPADWSGILVGKDYRMEARSNSNLRCVLETARGMANLADQGQAECEDDGCAVLYGLVRDCAYRIRGQAEREREAHRARGCWDTEDA
jgi:hypothetical protein